MITIKLDGATNRKSTEKMDTNGRPILLTIKVLGGETVMKITMKPEDTVQNMFDKVCEKLQLNERKYFGICELIYDDLNAPLGRLRLKILF